MGNSKLCSFVGASLDDALPKKGFDKRNLYMEQSCRPWRPNLMQTVEKLFSRPLFYTVVAAVVFSTLLALLAIQRHYNLESDEDLAMFDQMLWNVRNGNGLITTISGEASLLFRHHFFGEHVSPILYLFAWPAGLTRGPEALLILQALIFSLSAIPLARLVGRVLGNDWAGTAAAVFWLLMPNLWLAVFYDWHMEAAEPLFVFAFVLALHGGSKWAWLWAILYAFCKEDAPIYLAFVSVIFGWRSHRALGIKIAGFAVLYALLAWLVIGPACSASGSHQLVSRALTPSDCHGWRPWIDAVFFSAERWEALVRHLSSFGFLPLLGGLAVLPAAVAVGVDWLSISSFQFRMMMHYPFTVYPLLMLSAVWGLGHVFDRIRAIPASRGLFGLVDRNFKVHDLFGFVGASLDDALPKKGFDKRNPYMEQSRRLWPPNLKLMIFSSAVFAAVLAGLIFSWTLSLDAVRERLGTGGNDGKNILAGLPQDGKCAALLQLVSHCARRDDVTVLMAPQEADWLVLRLHGPVYTFPEDEYRRWLAGLLSGNSNYGVYCRPADTVVVLKKNHSTNENAKALAELLWTMEEDDVEHLIGSARRDAGALNGRAWSAGGDVRGMLWYGAYRDLPAGRYRARFRVKTKAEDETSVARLDVAEAGGKYVRGALDISGATGGYVWKTMEVTLQGAGNAECRAFKTGRERSRLTVLNGSRWRPNFPG